ncbi:MAG: 1-acyl-sn-glycerol-3-phosphate acyltransferase [Chitinispirillaceae bacterium]|nr:1-acyl-sn-glycerol-3-phosphate acyltransferase [Chitinispirillaceae bacterium]
MNTLFRLYQWFLWNVLTRMFFVNLFLKNAFPFRSTSGSQPFPKAPFLVVANHGTFFDPWIIGNFSLSPLGIMTNDDGFRDGIITKWYLKSIGAFPKKKGSTDYRAMKKTLSLLKNGVPVCIFPEGQTTWDGETQLLFTGIEKLVKRAKCPLVTVRLQGNFLMKPWWANKKRNGRILTTVTVHTPEAIAQLSDKDLFNLIKGSIYQNDIKDPDNIAAAFSGTDLAEGLERFIWICMNCGVEDRLETHRNRITCGSCGSSWEMDAHCRLTLPISEGTSCNDLKDWADLHKSRVKETIAKRADLLTTSEQVVLQQENRQQVFTNTDTGTLLLEPERLRFKGTNVDLHWPVAEIEDYVIQKKDIFEFRHGKQYQRFVFSGKSPMKWIYYLRYLKGFEKCEAQGHL